MAMLPARSTARLGMNRCMTFAASGSNVDACGRLAPTVPPVTSTWYQRDAAKPDVFCRRTVCVTHSDSTPPRLVYWFCAIALIWRESTAVPPNAGTLATAAFGQLVLASGVSGPVNADSEVLFQSTWNLYTVNA